MSNTITVDSVARVYIKSSDPEYSKQLDRGDTSLGVKEIDGTATLLPATETGLSHLMKQHNRAGTGRRSSISMKDSTHDSSTLVDEKNTVVVSFYGPYNSATSRARLIQLFLGLSTFLNASSGAEIEALLIGAIEVGT